MTINNVLDIIAWIRRQINKGGKEDPFKDIFLSSRYTGFGKSKPNILDETAKLLNELCVLQREKSMWRLKKKVDEENRRLTSNLPKITYNLPHQPPKKGKKYFVLETQK